MQNETRATKLMTLSRVYTKQQKRCTENTVKHQSLRNKERNQQRKTEQKWRKIMNNEEASHYCHWCLEIQL